MVKKTVQKNGIKKVVVDEIERHDAVIQNGETNMKMNIYYYKDMDFVLDFIYKGKEPTKSSFREHWKKLPITIDYDPALSKEQNFNKVFEVLNIGGKYHGNPMSKPDKQSWLRMNGVRHTSMSMGDIIQIGKEYWITAGIGFTKLKW